MPTQRWEFLLKYLDLEAATGVDGARWEHFQYAHLNDDSTFRIENKSRQIAWSWLAAAEGVAEAVLNGTSSSYVSINLDEAAEKVRYAKQIYHALRIGGLPKMVRDSLLSVEFDSGARLLSLPARPPRGKSRMNIYLDEFAHVMFDKDIYTAALPVISKGGRLRIGSSPMGASGRFWEVFSESLQKYPGYNRKQTPWWECYSFSSNPGEARKVAPGLLTAERVERYGKDRIRAICGNMPEEDFRQEYECEFVDESTSWITWEEIKAIQDPKLFCMMVSGVDNAIRAINRVKSQIGNIEQVQVAGVDIGRTRNTTEIYVVGLVHTGQMPLRLAITLDNVDFQQQADVLCAVCRHLPIATMWMDQNGIGRNLAETVSGYYPGKAQGVDFTNASKALWAANAKMLIQQRKPIIPSDRELAYQLHSIKKRVTPSRNVTFDTDANEKHHADRAWALFLALSAALELSSGPSISVEEY